MSMLHCCFNSIDTNFASKPSLRYLPKKIVVIGGVAAGTSAALKAKRFDPSADVKIIQEESVVSYGACGIPYV
jgi:hypothetical protein